MSPVENSLFPTSMTTLSRVRPCDLWIVTAQASLSGSWRREHWPPEEDQQRRRGVMGTVLSVKDESMADESMADESKADESKADESMADEWHANMHGNIEISEKKKRVYITFTAEKY